MPVVEVKALQQPKNADVPEVLRQVCREIAREMRISEKHVWAIWQTLKPGYFAEGDITPDFQPLATHPPIIRISAFEGWDAEEIERLLAVTAKTVGGALGLEEGNVFVTYHEVKSGQVFDGGEIVRK